MASRFEDAPHPGRLETCHEREAFLEKPESTSQTPFCRGFCGAGLVFLSVFAVHLVLFQRTFGVLPTADDFTVLDEIRRGREEGILRLFARSGQAMNYRPLQSVVLWAAASIDPPNRVFWLHVAGSVCFAILAAATAWAAHVCRLGITATVCAAVVLLLGPASVATTVSLDGFCAPAAVGVMWLGVIGAYAARHRPRQSLLILAAAFVTSVLLKEYALAIVLLGPWTMLFAQRQRRLHWAATSAVMLCGLTLALIAVRTRTIAAGGNTGMGYVVFDPILWAKNIVALTAAICFPGDTSWVYLNRGPVAYAVLAGGCGLVVAMLAGGVAFYWRAHDGEHRARVFYWVGAFFLAMFPPFLTRVSEMYVIGAMLPFCILAGMACEGWLRAPRRVRGGIVVMWAAVSLWGAYSAQVKVRKLWDIGIEADRRLASIASQVPGTLRDATIHVYQPRSMLDTPHYSVYLPPEPALLCDEAIDWALPGRGLRGAFYFFDDAEAPDVRAAELNFIWDPVLRTFVQPQAQRSSGRP
ncbi:MAG TPA: hypothetical protein VF624_07930 [Tepidisphaeraceae bacterium]